MEGLETLRKYTDRRMEILRSEGRNITAKNYDVTLRCLMRYVDSMPDDSKYSKDLLLDDLTSEFIRNFNAYLEGKKFQRATISFYNRTLRSIYNQAAREGLIDNRHPFDGVYTKVSRKLTPQSPTTIKTESGEVITIDNMSKDELVKKYKTLLCRYNTLVNKLMAVVGN